MPAMTSSLLPLAVLIAVAAASPAAAQGERPERGGPAGPPPLRLVCWTGPAVGDFCPLTLRTELRAPCSCPRREGARPGQAELR
jgi:hypothetical protein